VKKLFFILLLTLPYYLFAQTAKIKIDIDRTIGKIDPKIYGVFMEPIEFNPRRFGLSDTTSINTMYGILYDPYSPIADENGFKKNYIEAMKELKITNMRWPGGNYVAGYNWQDGIGPKEQRPVRKDLAWGAIDNNHVGTDEWIQLNRSIGSENVICVNLGLGSINDARYWVEYCNLEKGTYYSDLRARYGNPEPFKVKYWCLGNEVDGSPWIMGYKNAEDYCKVAIEAAKAMKATDNTIKFISNGSSYYESTGKWIDWNWKVITELRNYADYLSIHRYCAKAMYTDMKPLYISVDEWAPHGRNLLSTLAVAMYFNSFIRHADIVKMANFTLLTSLLGYDRENGTYKTPLFYTFKLLSNNCLGNSVDTYVECDTFNTDKYKGIPFLDVTTVYSEETNTVYLNVVNRHKDNPIIADIITSSGEFTGKAEAKTVTGDSLKDPFIYDKQVQYIPVKEEIKTEKNKISYSFPAHSFTQIKAGVKRQ